MSQRERLDDALNALRTQYADCGYRLETRITAFMKRRKPRGWLLMEPTWDYAECPQCHATKHTYTTSTDDPARPYSYHKYLCGICGKTWEATKIHD